MKKRLYSIGKIVVPFLILLLIGQVLLSSYIKKEIMEWCDNKGLEYSNFKCRVNLLTRNIAIGRLTLKKGEGDFQIERANISFYLLDFLSKRGIQRIHINGADIKLNHIPSFNIPTKTKSPNSNLGNSAKNPFFISELKIDNLILKIELPGGGKIPDINIDGLLKNIGEDRNTTFTIKTSPTHNSSFIEIKGDFNFSNWKQYLSYHIQGKDISLGILNVFEEGFLPLEVREQLLSLYFKNILLVDLRGKLDISGDGEIKDQVIDSKLKFLVSNLSCETENEDIKALVKRLQKKEKIEVTYEIEGKITNPHLKYDIVF
jgi:hypothetical protein